MALLVTLARPNCIPWNCQKLWSCQTAVHIGTNKNLSAAKLPPVAFPKPWNCQKLWHCQTVAGGTGETVALPKNFGNAKLQSVELPKNFGPAKLLSILAAPKTLALPNCRWWHSLSRETARNFSAVKLPPIAMRNPWHCQTAAVALPNHWHCEIAVRGTSENSGTAKLPHVKLPITSALPNYCPKWHCQKTLAPPNCRLWHCQNWH